MQIQYSKKFKDNLAKLPISAKKQTRNKLEIMYENLKHPSLRTKKIKGTKNIYESSVNMDTRITWQYVENGILLRNIGHHDRTLKNH